jgi:hypothetical protein
MFDYSLPEARQAILSGHRIVPVMVPDPSLAESYANPLPEYEESYPLLSLCLNGDGFWGLTGGTNVPRVPGQGVGHQLAFAYTNTAPLYLNMPHRLMAQAMTHPECDMVLCSLNQYREFRFAVLDDAAPVWDGAQPQAFDALRAAIAEGRYFRLVFESEDGLIYSLAVDLPMFFPELRQLTVHTHPAVMPEFCANPQQLIDKIEGANPDILKSTSPMAVRSRLRATLFPVYFSLESDGRYASARDIGAGRSRRWRTARLFAY